MISFFLWSWLILLSVLHVYLYRRLLRDPRWPKLLRVAIGLVLGLSALCFPVVLLMRRQLLFHGDSFPFMFGGLVWIGFLYFLTLIFVPLDTLRLLVRPLRRRALRRRLESAARAGDAVQMDAAADAALAEAEPGPGPRDPDRRVVLARATALLATGGAAAFSFGGLRAANGDIETVTVPVRLSRLPRALDGLTVVQLTDVHVGIAIRRAVIQTLVDQVNALRPDVVVLTGDFVDGSVAALSSQVEPFARLKTRYGVYFVTGNHEYYSGADAWIQEFTRLGIRVLRNERVSIGDRASFDLAGVDDLSGASRAPGHGFDLARALAGRDLERELVLLAHQPKAILSTDPFAVGLQLSGHTHGGQLPPLGLLVPLVQPYVAGLHRHNELTQIYVSRGTGYVGPPMRVFAPPEVTRLVLLA